MKKAKTKAKNKPKEKPLQYGPVVVTKGRYKDRTGYYDDDSDEGNKAIVYFGSIHEGWQEINPAYLRNIVERDQMFDMSK